MSSRQTRQPGLSTVAAYWECHVAIRAASWGEMDRAAIGVHHRVNFARQAPSRATHILVIVVRDTGSVLVHAHDGGIDHLHRRVMTGGQRFHDLVPDASPPPTN